MPMLRTMRAAHEHDLAVVGDRGIQHLLHAVHVAGEARDDHPARRLGDDGFEHRADVALERREPGHVGVRGVGQEQVDALLAQPRERAQVGDAAVERQLVHLEVAGVRARARPGVVIATASASGIEWLTAMNSRLERAELLVLALLDRERVRL